MAAGVPRFSIHTVRHQCLTDLACMGWKLHEIATFAGHCSTDSTLRYIHLSGQDLPEKLSRGMQQSQAWRVEQLAGPHKIAPLLMSEHGDVSTARGRERARRGMALAARPGSPTRRGGSARGA